MDSISLTKIKCRPRCDASCSIYIRPILRTCVVFLNLLREQIQLSLPLYTGCSDRSFQQWSTCMRYICVTYGLMHVKLQIFDRFIFKSVSCAIIHICTAEPPVQTDMTSCDIRGGACFTSGFFFFPLLIVISPLLYTYRCILLSVDSPNHIITSSVFKIAAPSLTTLRICLSTSITDDETNFSSFEANGY
jgi:hypothetical protein